MHKNCSNKFLGKLEKGIEEEIKLVKEPNQLLESKQEYNDKILMIYQDAFKNIINYTKSYSTVLGNIKKAYENSLQIRNERIAQFALQDKVFGISLRKKERDDEVKVLSNENEQLKNNNLELTSVLTKLKQRICELQQEKFSDYVTLVRERNSRCSLYQRNLQLEEQMKQMRRGDAGGRDDPLLLRVALERCREQLAAAQRELARLVAECVDTVPRRDFAALEARERDLRRELRRAADEHHALEDSLSREQAQKKSLQEELEESKERCRELERAGTPRPQWQICADFIGDPERWRRLARGLSSREALLLLLRELGPAADTHHLEYFDGLGMDGSVPPYLRYSGRVRNLRLSRRELAVIIDDVWRSKAQRARHVPLQDYLTHYFEERYQQEAVRAECAYNVCAAAEQALDDPQVRVFWSVLRGRLGEDVYWAHRDRFQALKAALYRHCGNGQTITLEEFEKVAKATFSLKSEVDIKNLSDVVRKQLKVKINQNHINLDKLFFENEEGFDRLELGRELFRQQRREQERYVRELARVLAGPRARSSHHAVTVDSLKRAFALLDPAIDHVRMERNIRWAFAEQTRALDGLGPLPLRAVLARLGAGHVERAGPPPRRQNKAALRTTFYK